MDMKNMSNIECLFGYHSWKCYAILDESVSHSSFKRYEVKDMCRCCSEEGKLWILQYDKSSAEEYARRVNTLIYD